GRRVEELLLEDLGGVDEARARGETRGEPARPDGQRELGEERLQITHVVRDRVFQELVARLMETDDVEVRPYALALRQEPRGRALVQLDLDLDAARQRRSVEHDVELLRLAERDEEPVGHDRALD